MQHGSEDLMNIKSLQLFIHLCDSKSFAKTAAAMHISPSALSRQIQKLEEETHQQLFLRDNRSVELTVQGKKLLPVALKILGEWQQYQSYVKGTEDELKGEIRLFCSVTASYSHLPELISEFRIQHPFIEFKLSTGDPAKPSIRFWRMKLISRSLQSRTNYPLKLLLNQSARYLYRLLPQLESAVLPKSYRKKPQIGQRSLLFSQKQAQQEKERMFGLSK